MFMECMKREGIKEITYIWYAWMLYNPIQNARQEDTLKVSSGWIWCSGAQIRVFYVRQLVNTNGPPVKITN